MDLATDSLTTQLTDNPMLLLEIPESIFELFESDKPTGHGEYGNAGHGVLRLDTQNQLFV